MGSESLNNRMWKETSFYGIITTENGTGKRPTERSKIQNKGKQALYKMGEKNSSKGESSKILQGYP